VSAKRFDPGLAPGQILTGDDLQRVFTCDDRGGMRWSQETRTLVVLSDQFEAIAPDRWDGAVLHFAAVDLPGERELDGASMGALTGSDGDAGAAVYLLEKLGPDQYLFDGAVQLAGPPCRETRVDYDGRPHDVWILPLKLTGRQEPPAMPAELVAELRGEQERRARHLNQAELTRRAALARETPESRAVLATTYSSDPYIAELARRRAAGHCQLCGSAAPFRAKGGRPFLEVHHLLWLSRGGLDTLANTAALCPDCHRRMHVLDHEADRTRLTQVLQEPERPTRAEPLGTPTASDAEVEEFYEALTAEAQAQMLPPLRGKPDNGLPL
jgi:5-methylcytosine-specific restriction enzyme A